MKKSLLYLFTVIVSMTFIFATACNNDDDGYSESDLIGTWWHTHSKSYYWKNENSEPEISDKTYTKNDEEVVYWTFQSDGKLLIEYRSSESSNFDNADWYLKGNKLYVTFAEEETYIVNKLTSTTLQIFWKRTYFTHEKYEVTSTFMKE